MKKVFICGESWIGYTLHIKGADSFSTTGYKENVRWLKNALELAGYEITYMPIHVALSEFPDTVEKLKEYDMVILSDIGSSTLLMTTPSFTEGKKAPNRCEAIRQYVMEGGSFLMIGGFLSFTGIEGKARYGMTAIADILPVKLLPYDDREERSDGCTVELMEPEHPVLKGIEGEWPYLVGFNKTVEDASRGKVLAKINGYPFIAVGEFGKGKSAVYTSDCAPHWASPEFLAWKGYNMIWKNLADWLTQK
ncbi:MAG: cytoplasmic protein [Clostridiales bacterium]|jgi:uncharacterized membrane protein|nr:cytoplasmic protein [Clostridiales bacterium]